MKAIIIFAGAILLSSSIFAQSAEKSKHKSSSKKEIDRGATYDVNSSKSSKKKRQAHGYSNDYDKKVEEFEARMKSNAKKYAKMEKEMKKPQYSDPTYFGHKKKPKKRPPGKKKYCKECGMYH